MRKLLVIVAIGVSGCGPSAGQIERYASEHPCDTGQPYRCARQHEHEALHKENEQLAEEMQYELEERQAQK